jgi:uncharacterized protein YndB with AHSA1/START domain
MSNRSAVHETFVIRRAVPYRPELVYAAWASAEGKSQWFFGPAGSHLEHREMDFRAGGQETAVCRFTDGKVTRFDARYLEIQPGERIIYAYEMHRNDVRISVSLTTIEFRIQASGTELVVTEQGVFLDGHDDVGTRERGTRLLMDQLERALQRSSAR